MNSDYKNFINSVMTIPFSHKLKYFMSLRSLTPKSIEEKSNDGKGTIIQARTIFRYLKGENTPKPENIDRLAELLEIPPNNLTEDIGQYWRALSKVRHELDNENFTDNFLDKNGELSLYGDYEFDGSEFTDESEIDIRNNELINNKILDSYKKMDLFHCYKLVKNFEVYIKIHEYAWNLLCNFSSLNSTGKEKIKKYISHFQTSIDFQLKNLHIIIKYVSPFFYVRNTSENDLRTVFDEKFEKFDSENEVRNVLWDELYMKLSKVSWGDVERFFNQMNSIITMDSEDWNILISYFLLTDVFLYMPSEKQEMLLRLSDELVKDNVYSNVSQ